MSEKHDTASRKSAARTPRPVREEPVLVGLEEQAELLDELVALLDLADDTIIICDMQRRIVLWNHGAELQYGWSKEEAMDRNCHELLNTRFPQALEEIEAVLFASGRWEGELIHHTKSGAPIIVSSRWAVQKNRKGNPIALLEISHDITAKKASEKALQESERRYRFLADNITDLIVIIDFEMRCRYVSPSIERLLGYTPQEALALSPEQIFTPDSLKLAWEKQAEMLAAEKDPAPPSGRMFTIEYEMVHKNGATSWFEMKVKLLRDGDGKPYSLLAVGRDITERRAAEEALRLSEERLRVGIAHAHTVVFSQDTQLRYTWVHNPNQQLSVEELIGKRDDELYPPKQAQRLTQMKQRVLDSGRGLREEICLTYQGKDYWYDLTIEPLRNADGSKAGIIASGVDITEHKRALEALRASQERYRYIVETSLEGIVLVNRDRRVVFVNQRMADLLGYAVAEVMGRDYFTFLDEASQQVATAELKTLAGGEKIRTDFRLKRKDGGDLWTIVSAAPLFEADNTYSGFLAMVTDITSRKKAEEHTAWLATFPQLNFNPIVEVDAAGHIHYLNPAAQRLFPDLVELGAQHPWLAGLTWLAEQVRMAGNQPFTRDVEINGVWYKQSAFSVPGSSRIRIYGLENTEAKLAERQLRLANQQLQDIIEFLPDATMVIDRKKRVIAWNKAIEEMTGLSKKDIIGKTEYAYAVPFYGKPRPMLIDLVGRSDREMEKKYSFIKRRKSILFAEVFVPQVYNGKGAFVWAKASPLYDSDGHMVGAIETIRDITEQKQAEAILKNDKDAFEQMVNDKTEQLLNMQKELALAKHLSEIGALAATIAHELRNPLAAIRTAAYNITRKSRDSRLQSHLVNIEKKVVESDQIINNLLSYSRIKTPHYQTVAIHELLHECVSSARERFPRSNVSVQVKCACKAADTIKADPLQVREMFNNVLNNAFEAMPGKKGKIAVIAEYKPRGNFTVTFRDNGVGISSDDLKKISQPFFTTKSKGTGLGLTVCHQLVSLHNGTVKIDSEQGKGTAVTISLPVEAKTL